MQSPCSEEDPVTNLALVSSRQPAMPSTQWAHDIRNMLATIGLHLDTLARLSGPHGTKAANAAHALITKAGGICQAAVAAAVTTDGRSRRHPVDLLAVVRHAIDLVAPLGPEDLVISIAGGGSHFVMGDHTEIFRVLFNLLHNAVAVARSSVTLRRIEIMVERKGEITELKVSDNGRGLPAQVFAKLFRGSATVGARHGHGLAIARELMERNGGMLTCETSRKGTTFCLAFAALTSIRVAEGPVTRSLGRRADG